MDTLTQEYQKCESTKETGTSQDFDVTILFNRKHVSSPKNLNYRTIMNSIPGIDLGSTLSQLGCIVEPAGHTGLSMDLSGFNLAGLCDMFTLHADVRKMLGWLSFLKM